MTYCKLAKAVNVRLKSAYLMIKCFPKELISRRLEEMKAYSNQQQNHVYKLKRHGYRYLTCTKPLRRSIQTPRMGQVTSSDVHLDLFHDS